MLKKDDRDQQMVYYQVNMLLISSSVHNTEGSFEGGYRNVHHPTDRYSRLRKVLEDGGHGSRAES